MSRQLITVRNRKDREELVLLLDNFFSKSNYSSFILNNEKVIKKNSSFNFLNEHYIKIYFKDDSVLIEGWFTVSGKDYGLDDGIMHSEKDRALSQTIEAIVSLLNSSGASIENGTVKDGNTIDCNFEYELKNSSKNASGIIFFACSALIIAAAFFLRVSIPCKAVIIVFGLIIGIKGLRD